VILPGHTVFEKSGTFINQQFRIQKFNAAIPPLAGTNGDMITLAKLLAALGGPSGFGDLTRVWQAIAEEISILTGVSFAGLPEEGLLLNATDFANLPFAEAETLHYKPVAAPAAATTAG
jgi:NADH-quinone oxidoreductase subunit G